MMFLSRISTFLLVIATTKQSLAFKSVEKSVGAVEVEGISESKIPNNVGLASMQIQPLDMSDRSHEAFTRDGLLTSATSPYPSCVLFSDFLSYPEDYPYSTCASAVTYKFYQPAYTTLNYLEKAARSILNNTALALLPTTCQKAVKKLVCSNVYLPCYGTLGLSATYNPYIYSDVGLGATVPVPFKRPCKEVCENVDTDCFGALSLLGLAQNCSAKYDYSNGAVPLLPNQYDSGNDASVCNAMSTDFDVGSQEEAYGGSQCAGIVDNLYVVPASKVSTALAPMQATGVVQTAIESELATYFGQLPVFVSKDCRFALKKYFCRSAMPTPTSLTFEQALVNNSLTGALPYLEAAGIDVADFAAATVYLPSFPSQAVCQDYANTCADFLKIANNPLLTPNCDGVTDFGGRSIPSYPSVRETVVSLPVALTTPYGVETVELKLYSQPDQVSSATATGSSYDVHCPLGFVEPNDPDDSRITWVPGTGCAVECRTPQYTNEEFNAEDRAMDILAIIGIPATFFVFCIYLADEKRRKEGQTVILFAFFAFINAVSYMSLRGTPSAAVCANNAVGMQSGDGANLCTVTSFINMYCLMACCVAWSLFSVDKFLKIVMGFKNNILFEFNIAAVLLYPLIAVIGSARLNLWGYSNGPRLCFFSGQNPHDFKLFGVFLIPVIVLVALAFISKVAVIVVVTCTNKRLDITPSMKFKEVPSSSTEVVTANQPVVLGDEESNSGAASSAEPVGRTVRRPTLTEIVYDVNDFTYDHSVWDLITSVLFNQIFFALWVMSLYFRVNGYFAYYDQHASFEDWADCAFTHFEYPSQDWQKICGGHPGTRQLFGLHITYYMFIGGQGTLFAAIFLANPILWYELYQKMMYMFTGRSANEKKDENGIGFVGVPVNENKTEEHKAAVAELDEADQQDPEAGENENRDEE